MEVHFHFFGPMRDAVGRKRVTQEFETATTVGAALDSLCDAFEPLEEVLKSGEEWSTQMNVTVDGENVRQLAGYDTELSDGTVVRLTPPIVGG